MTVSERVVVADDESTRRDALAVRRTVFVDEQGVPPDLEVDAHDETATHFVAYCGDQPVGAARLRRLDETTGKVERVAVLAAVRGQGWGGRLMDALERTARERGLTRLTMHAQTQAAGFYRRLGYRAVGDEFEEAGIPHVEMTKSFEASVAE